MNTAEIQKKCEEFLASTGLPGFIILGFQTDTENTQVVYSMKDMPIKGAVKGITHTLNDLMGRL